MGVLLSKSSTGPTPLTFVTEVMDVPIIGCVKWELPALCTSHQIKFNLLIVLCQQTCGCQDTGLAPRRKNRAWCRMRGYLRCFPSNCFLLTKAGTGIVIVLCFLCNCFKSFSDVGAVRSPWLWVSLEPIKFVFPRFCPEPHTRKLLVSTMKWSLIMWMGLKLM